MLLHTMQNSDGFIDGIFNYCDRWCERCPLTARCRVFAMEQGFEEARTDAENAAFWTTLDGMASQEESDGFDIAEEFDADVIEAHEPWREERERAEDDGMKHPLAEAGLLYGAEAHRWLRRHGEQVIAASPGESCGIAPSEAFDVLNWYCLQIGVKLSRAFSDLRDLDEESWDTGSGWEETDEITDAVQEADRTDRAGSAKVALIGIERSLGAWSMLRATLPEHTPAILDFLKSLGRLRRAIDEQVPEARTFCRPGFDDGNAAE
jgi:hypothetical protein